MTSDVEESWSKIKTRVNEAQETLNDAAQFAAEEDSLELPSALEKCAKLLYDAYCEFRDVIYQDELDHAPNYIPEKWLRSEERSATVELDNSRAPMDVSQSRRAVQ